MPSTFHIPFAEITKNMQMKKWKKWLLNILLMVTAFLSVIGVGVWIAFLVVIGSK